MIFEGYKKDVRDIAIKQIKKHIETLKISDRECVRRINAYCKAHGIENERYSDLEYISVQQFDYYTTQTNKAQRIPIEFIHVFAETFNVSFDYLFGRAETPSRNDGIEAAAAAIGTSDPETIGALQKIYAVWRNINPHYDFADNPPPYRFTAIAGSGYDITNILDEIIQSEFFSEMFTGYTLHINNKYFCYGYSIKYEQARNEFYATHGHPEKVKKVTLLEELEYDNKLEDDAVWARIARNALAAIENSDLSIRAYLDKRLLREIDEMKQNDHPESSKEKLK